MALTIYHRCVPQSPFSNLVTLNAPIPFIERPLPQLKTFGDHLKRKRMEDGLHKTELARILDVDECTIHFWENNKTKIQITYYPRIIAFLGYHPFADNPNTLPDIIRVHREKLGLSIREFARTLSVDPETVKRYERNKISKYSRVRKIFELEIPELKLILDNII